MRIAQGKLQLLNLKFNALKDKIFKAVCHSMLKRVYPCPRTADQLISGAVSDNAGYTFFTFLTVKTSYNKK
jgi:hypothetical protein